MDDGGNGGFSLTSGLDSFLHETDGPGDGQARGGKCGSKEAADIYIDSQSIFHII